MAAFAPPQAGEVSSPEIGWRRALRFAKLVAMKSTAKNIIRPAPPSDIAARVDAVDWTQVGRELDAQGCAVLKGLLSAAECRALAAFYPDDSHFRSRIVMGRHGFGRGEYKYFSYPLPGLIAELRLAFGGLDLGDSLDTSDTAPVAKPATAFAK